MLRVCKTPVSKIEWTTKGAREIMKYFGLANDDPRQEGARLVSTF